MNNFEKFVLDVRAWQAKRFFGVVVIVSALMMLGGWVIGLHAFFSLQDEGILGTAEIHQINTSDFGSDHSTYAARMCSAVYVPATRQMELHFYPDNPGNPSLGLESDREFCERVMQGVPRWRDMQNSYPLGWGERIFWGVLTLLVAGSGLLLLLTLASFAGLASRVVSLLLLGWYAVSILIFFTSAYDERRPSWTTKDGHIDVQPIYLTRSGRVMSRPDTIYEWAVKPPQAITSKMTLELVKQLTTARRPGTPPATRVGLLNQPLGNIATDADGDVELLGQSAEAVDGKSVLSDQLGGKLPRVDVTDPQVRERRTMLLLELERCGPPKINEEKFVVLAHCRTVGDVAMAVAGGGDQRRTYEQLRNIRPGGSYYVIGLLDVGPKGQLVVVVY